MYCLGDGANAEGWPFLLARHAYLADGTPLTEYDRDGRIVASQEALGSVAKICSGGCLSLADRRDGLEALARALEKGDAVRAPILLLQLQIDPAPGLAKHNPWHKPPGPGGGQFASNPETGATDGNPFGLQPVAFNMHLGPNLNGAPGTSVEPPPGFEQVAADLHVGMTSTYVPGVYGEDIDIAHNLVTLLVWMAILKVTTPGFTPGMPGYGQELHQALADEINALNGVSLHAEQAYLLGIPVPIRLPGSSVPDAIYGPLKGPMIVWDLKTGRSATDINAADVAKQKAKTLANMPGNPLYEYIQVYGK